MNIWERKKPSFGFVSTRFSGLDGVSLETKKWMQVLTAKGCQTCFLAGEIDTPAEVSRCEPLLSFKDERILKIQASLFQEGARNNDLSREIDQYKWELKKIIYDFYREFNFDILVVENAFTIPLNIPLGLALTEFISEANVNTIAHHHDFYWERDRFSNPAANDYLRAAFPPVHPLIQHTVINSQAGQQLARNTGESSTLIPNVIDFKIYPSGIDSYNSDFREAIGVNKEDLLVLHPTRIVSRKAIETSIEIVKKLKSCNAVLVITHDAGDEGFSYLYRIREYAELLDIRMKIVSDRVGIERASNENGEKIYSFWDTYYNADLISYPSLYEGYGNAFVEAVYARKPIVVNRYKIFNLDIMPKKFDVISFDRYITKETIRQIEEVLDNRKHREEIVEKNYMLGWRYLSYEMLEEKLEQILISIYGS